MKVEKLKKFLKSKGIEADFHEFSDPTISVEDSSEQLGVEPDKIVKSLVFIDQDGNPILAIVPGTKRVDEEELSKVHGSEVRIAKAREVEEFSGYKIGEVPPIGHDLKTVMDREILNSEKVIAGGGSTHTLMELEPKDIVEVTDAVLAEISA